MIIVSGRLRTAADERDGYVTGCRDVIELARQAPGCLDFHITADPIDGDCVNVDEQWASVADVEAFRGSGPSSDQQAAILDAAVYHHMIESTERL